MQAGASLSALSVMTSTARSETVPGQDHAIPRGVMFDRDELPRIQKSLQHPTFASYWRSLQEADLTADRRFLTVEVDTMNRVRDLARVANIAFRSAFVHVIEPNEQQRTIAELAVATALKFNRWDWILEDGVHTVGVMRGPMVGVLLSCALDWLGEEVDPNLRDGVMQRLGEEIGPASYRAVHGELGATPMPKWTMDLESTGLTVVDVSQWPKILADTNLQIIATSGLLISASMLPDHPDATKWRKLAERSLREFIAKQPADGSFDEGSAYWGFTYNYFCLCLEFLRRFHGIDERGIADFPAMARYFLRSTMPTHETPRDTLSIGDCSNSGSVIALAWIGREFRDSTAQHLLTRPGMATLEPTLCWGAIWFDPTVPTNFAADMNLDYTLAPGLAVSRTGWTDRDALLCLRSGEPCNHEHADRNSLLFAAFGERLLNDPIRASYDPKAPGWLLRQTEAHTALLIGGRGHIYHHGEEGTNASLAHAHLIAHQVDLNGMNATSDATEAYRLAGHPVTRVVRTAVYLKPDLLVVYDAVDLERAEPIEIRFQAFNRDGKGGVEADEKSIRIRRPLAGLKVVATGAQPVSLHAGQLDLPPDMPVYPYGAVKSSAATNHRVLSICTAHRAAVAPTDVSWHHENGSWLITGKRDGKPFEIRLTEHPSRLAPIVTVMS
ncbi:MAG: hypothetical protein SynsKO_04020 [Synoicihabitans sp.]